MNEVIKQFEEKKHKIIPRREGKIVKKKQLWNFSME
jgi:predicted SpoU family rRNA methylase